MSNTIISSQNKPYTFLQISDNEFLVEGKTHKAKIKGESEYAITAIDLHNGPLIHIGKDFLGRGIVSIIDIIETDNQDNLIIKVTI